MNASVSTQRTLTLTLLCALGCSQGGEEATGGTGGTSDAESTGAVTPTTGGELDPDLYASIDPLDQLRAQVDIATGALLAGLTNVVVVSVGSGSYYWSSEYPNLAALYPDGKLMGGHDLRHGDNDVTNNVLHEVSSRSIGEMARMARTLAAQPEAGGTRPTAAASPIRRPATPTTARPPTCSTRCCTASACRPTTSATAPRRRASPRARCPSCGVEGQPTSV